MDVKAILLVGGHETPFAGRPAVLLDVLGKPLLHRIVETLREQLAADITVVLEPKMLEDPLPVGVKALEAQAESHIRATEQAFDARGESAPETILLIRLGGYAEIDWKEMVECHQKQRAKVLRAYKGTQALDIFCLSPLRSNEAAYLLRNDLQRTRTDSLHYQTHGYVNSLQTPHDLRKLATDALHRRCQMQPVGKQIRPGIWAGEGARVDRGARLVAPVYIGKRAKVRSGAVVTRSSAVEHHSVIDCGTVVENATVLPFSILGPGLDVSHSIVGARQIFHLKRNAQAVIEDPKLLDESSPNVGIRLLAGVGALVSFLPRLAYEGFRSSKADEPEQPKLDAVTAECSKNYGATNVYEKKDQARAVAEFPGALAVAREYGNQ